MYNMTRPYQGATWLENDVAQVFEDVRVLRRDIGGLVADVVFVAGSPLLRALGVFTRPLVVHLGRMAKKSARTATRQMARHPKSSLLLVAGAGALVAMAILRQTRQAEMKAMGRGRKHREMAKGLPE